MGFFDFVKDIGKRVINSDEGVAKDIKEAIEGNNPGVKNLGVNFERGIVTLNGHCDSGKAHKRVVQMAKGHEGVVDVYFNNLTYNETKPAADSVATAIASGATAVGGGDTARSGAEPKTEEYEIQSGDTLSKLAKKYYGDAMQYPKIFEANRDTIEDPNKIYVGQKIRIPLD